MMKFVMRLNHFGASLLRKIPKNADKIMAIVEKVFGQRIKLSSITPNLKRPI
jgi:hypothetical protein